MHVVMTVRVWNSLRREKEDLVPLVAGKLGIYVCGVTVYDLCHVGHARVYVVFDTIVRWLRRSHDVTYVRNFTDVDDKIIKRAHENGEEPLALAARFIDEFHDDMAWLDVRKADVEPKVSTHMPEILALLATLEERGFAYRTASTTLEGASDVYFRVRHMDAARYAQLSGRHLDDLCAGARVAVDERKEDPLDFALWKSAKPGEVSWESPYGRGRPGWHIECSAMSKKHLGVTFDLHGGGKDLIFPHHTNEIAQSECAHGTEMARAWLHNGFINFNDDKMSKSVGNFFTIRQLRPFCTGEALRFFLLSTHYRSDVNFEVVSTDTARRVRFPNLDEAERRVQYLAQTTRRIAHAIAATPPDGSGGHTLASVFGKADAPFTPWQDFAAALDDDFNTPGAITALNEVLKAANLLVAGREKELCGQKHKPAVRAHLLVECQQLVQQMSEVLGISGASDEAFLTTQRALRVKAMGLDEQHIERLLGERSDKKANKDYQGADAIRDQLAALGVEVMDTKEGVEWSVV